MSDRRLSALEAMRGVAAIWVVLHHATLSTSAFIGDVSGASIFSNGFLGVDFFFVLSGFIIAFSSAKLVAAGMGAGAYVQARLIRIYVPYLPVGVGILLLYFALPSLSGSDRSPGIVTSLTLLPTNSPPALSVAWTLVHEVIFYCLYSFFFFYRKALYVGFLVWACAIGYLHFSHAELSRLQEYFFSPLNLCFLIGVLVFHASRFRHSVALAWAAMLVGTATVGVVASSADPNRAFSALGFALLVWAGSSALLPQSRIPKVMVMLGAASYSIYLVHNPVLSIIVRAVRALLPGGQPWLAFTVISLVAMACGVAYWAIYERNVLRWVRNRLGGSKAKISRPVAGT